MTTTTTTTKKPGPEPGPRPQLRVSLRPQLRLIPSSACPPTPLLVPAITYRSHDNRLPSPITRRHPAIPRYRQLRAQPRRQRWIKTGHGSRTAGGGAPTHQLQARCPKEEGGKGGGKGWGKRQANLATSPAGFGCSGWVDEATVMDDPKDAVRSSPHVLACEPDSSQTLASLLNMRFEPWTYRD